MPVSLIRHNTVIRELSDDEFEREASFNGFNSDTYVERLAVEGIEVANIEELIQQEAAVQAPQPIPDNPFDVLSLPTYDELRTRLSQEINTATEAMMEREAQNRERVRRELENDPFATPPTVRRQREPRQAPNRPTFQQRYFEDAQIGNGNYLSDPNGAQYFEYYIRCPQHKRCIQSVGGIWGGKCKYRHFPEDIWSDYNFNTADLFPEDRNPNQTQRPERQQVRQYETMAATNTWNHGVGTFTAPEVVYYTDSVVTGLSNDLSDYDTNT